MDSFIKWIGGKKRLRKEILSRFPEQYERYIEVFGGAGWVLFGIEPPCHFEVFNDLNGDLINLYRCVKYHSQELQRELNFSIQSRELFFDAVNQMNTRGYTDIQRAARYFLIIKESFGADLSSFGTRPTNFLSAVDYLTDMAERLKSTVIENQDFEKILKTYDRKESLFYLDPPYVETEKYYAAEFTKADHIRLKNALQKVKGKFILSYNDCKFIRELYAEYRIEGISRKNHLNGQKSEFQELIIRNY